MQDSESEDEALLRFQEIKPISGPATMTVNVVDGYQPSVERLEIEQLRRIKNSVREVRSVVHVFV